jgi:hypothetical protein
MRLTTFCVDPSFMILFADGISGSFTGALDACNGKKFDLYPIPNATKNNDENDNNKDNDSNNNNNNDNDNDNNDTGDAGADSGGSCSLR